MPGKEGKDDEQHAVQLMNDRQHEETCGDRNEVRRVAGHESNQKCDHGVRRRRNAFSG
jgi:hypothetical protein